VGVKSLAEAVHLAAPPPCPSHSRGEGTKKER
jgi:hypothetical protein